LKPKLGFGKEPSGVGHIFLCNGTDIFAETCFLLEFGFPWFPLVRETKRALQPTPFPGTLKESFPVVGFPDLLSKLGSGNETLPLLGCSCQKRKPCVETKPWSGPPRGTCAAAPEMRRQTTTPIPAASAAPRSGTPRCIATRASGWKEAQGRRGRGTWSAGGAAGAEVCVPCLDVPATCPESPKRGRRPSGCWLKVRTGGFECLKMAFGGSPPPPLPHP